MLRLLEHYTSVQGEGPRVGELTQFVRFAGCNLKCALWPCDTPEAIDPKLYRHEQMPAKPEEITITAECFGQDENAWNVCLTGGEPLLQNQYEIDELVRLLIRHGFHVEMFSNGTFPYTPTILEYVSIVMDWKLMGSGEAPYDAVRIQNFYQLDKYNHAGRDHVVKFTVASEDDLHQALSICEQYAIDTSPVQVYVGPVWGQMDPKIVVEFIKTRQLFWKLTLQTHKFIYGNVRSV